jgi:hypothetical protein
VQIILRKNTNNEGLYVNYGEPATNMKESLITYKSYGTENTQFLYRDYGGSEEVYLTGD